jgi:hypothetical protein
MAPRKRKTSGDCADTPVDSCPDAALDDIIARHQRAKTEMEERNRRERVEAERRDALLGYLLTAAAWGRGGQHSSPATDADNWVGLLHTQLTKAAPYVEGDIIGRLTAPGCSEARRVLVRVCRLIRSEHWEKAKAILAAGLGSTLSPELWADLSCQLPEDIAAMLPQDMQAMFREQRKPAQNVAPAIPVPSRAPAPPQHRLMFDDETLTVTLDGQPIRVDDQKAYAVYRAIAELYQPGYPVKNPAIQDRVRGLKGHNAVSDTLKKLPDILRETIETKTNGKTLRLPLAD